MRPFRIIRCLGALAALFLLTGLWAQDPYCQEKYQRAQAKYDKGQLIACLADLDTISAKCANDQVLLEQVLLLRAVVEFRLDSIGAMNRSLEQLQRNSRHPAITNTDPLIVDHYGVWAVYNEDVRVKFRKDHGMTRVGLLMSSLSSVPELGTPVPVFEGDAPLTYHGGSTLGFTGFIERDMIPNLSLRLSGTYDHLAYFADSPTQQYTEHLEYIGASLALKKAFWMDRSPWVPHVLVRFAWGGLLDADARIERFGDGLRYAPERSMDRVDQRAFGQHWVGAAVGIGRKLGSFIVHMEISYDRSLKDVTLPDVTYVESELLTNYYFKDTPFRLHKIGLGVGVQYILKYHSHNRIYR